MGRFGILQGPASSEYVGLQRHRSQSRGFPTVLPTASARGLRNQLKRATI
jgi:hypothetical protein